MAPPRQQDATAATSSQSKVQQPSSNNIKPSRTMKSRERAEPVAKPVARQPDEIEEPETIIPVKPAPSKPKPRRVEPADEDGDSDDAESVHLSEEDDEDDETSSDQESTDSDSDSDDSVEEFPRQLTTRQTGRRVQNTQGSPYTITQTRSETTSWITTQNNGNSGGVTRGTRTVNQQTTMHGQNGNGSRRRLNRNSVSFNMSINVDMSFNGLVTGRNLGFTGGSLSYAWNRRSTQGG
ncbi:hypothetical protein F66182_1648 [Fusarium sp. NRRL 66182]|nr:hypothetical protein F66182_1648 [Fusarium sp. NRRL 66182]